MKIAIMETEGKVGVSILSDQDYPTVEVLQREINQSGGHEKIAAFLEFEKKDELVGLIEALCAFGGGLNDTFQCALEKFLGEIFKQGKEYGRVTAKENIQNNLMRALEQSVVKETEMIGKILAANKE